MAIGVNITPTNIHLLIVLRLYVHDPEDSTYLNKIFILINYELHLLEVKQIHDYNLNGGDMELLKALKVKFHDLDFALQIYSKLSEQLTFGEQKF